MFRPPAFPARIRRPANRRSAVLVSFFVLLSVTACTGEPVPRDKAEDMSAFAPPSPWLKQLFAQSDEAMLQRNPLTGIVRGDLRYTGQFGEYFSAAYYEGERAAAIHDLAVLDSISRASLNANDQISYDTFKWQRTTDLRGYAPAVLAATMARPLDHFNGLHNYFVDMSSGQGAARFQTLKDYDDGLSRLKGFARELDTALVEFQAGAAAGIVHPKMITRNLIAQLDGYIAQGVDSSPLYGPITMFPAEIPTPEKLRLGDAYRETLAQEVLPAFVRLRDYLKKDYLKASRDSVGLVAMKNGPELYRHLVLVSTTTSLTPDSIHQIGLSEVARIRAAMDSVKSQVGFEGTLRQFFDHLRKDTAFQPKTADTLRVMYEAIGARVDMRVRDLFSTIPKTRLEIRAVPAYLERSEAAGYYNPGTPDGSRPGVFFYNTYDLPSRNVTGMETLYLHEAIPGHHFQISLAQENVALPNFQRFGGNTAFVEGWALYAESLGFELGMFTDPYQYFGSLNDEMLRAMRLVVDTGIHEKGWTQSQAIAYMMANSAMGKTDATIEVERYIAWPGQALGYKIGQLTIRRLRTEAERVLGAKFNVREFHTQVLSSGALPLEVLESKINRWMASK